VWLPAAGIDEGQPGEWQRANDYQSLQSLTNKNMTGIKEINQAGQHIPDHMSAITNNIERSLVSLAARYIDIFRPNNPAIGLSHMTQGGAGPVSSSLHRL